MAAGVREIHKGSFRLLTQSLVEDGAAYEKHIKQLLHDKEGIPAQHQRLVFSVAPSQSGPDSAEHGVVAGPAVHDFGTWQAILYKNNKSIGRLVDPRLEVTEELVSFEVNCWDTIGVPLQIVKLVYGTWQPALQDKKGLASPRELHLAVDEAFRSSNLRLQVFGRQQGEAFALPFCFPVSGNEVAAAASQQLQKLQYIRDQQTRHQHSTAEKPVVDQAPQQQLGYTFSCGSGLQRCTLHCDLKVQPVSIKQVALAIAVLPQQLLLDDQPAEQLSPEAVFPGLMLQHSHPAAPQGTGMDEVHPTSNDPRVDITAEEAQHHTKKRRGETPSPTLSASSHQRQGESSRSGSSSPSQTAAVDSYTTVEGLLPESTEHQESGDISTTAAVRARTSGASSSKPSSGSGGGAGDPSGGDSGDEGQDRPDEPPGGRGGISGGSDDGDGSGEGGGGGRRGNVGGSKSGRKHKQKQQQDESDSDNADEQLNNPATLSSSTASPSSPPVRPLSPSTDPAAAAPGSQGNGYGHPEGSIGSYQSEPDTAAAAPSKYSSSDSLASTSHITDSPTSSSGPLNETSVQQTVVHQATTANRLQHVHGHDHPPGNHASAAIRHPMSLPHSHSSSTLEAQRHPNDPSWQKPSTHVNGKYPLVNGKAKNGFVHGQGPPLGRTLSHPESSYPRPAPHTEHGVSGRSHSQTDSTGAQNLERDMSVVQRLLSHPLGLGSVPETFRAAWEQSDQSFTDGADSESETESQDSGVRRPMSDTMVPVSIATSSGAEAAAQDWSTVWPSSSGSSIANGPSSSGRQAIRLPRPSVRSHSATGMREQGHAHPMRSWPGSEVSSPRGHVMGTTDMDRFKGQITPIVQLDPVKTAEEALKELRLGDIWKFYLEPSLYGQEVYTLGGSRGPSLSYFVPMLSALQLFTPATPDDRGGSSRLYVCEKPADGWPKHMHLLYEYFEPELPWNRSPMHDQLEILADAYGGESRVLMDQRVHDLHPASWYAVAWYPVYRIPDAPLQARFLTYHSLGPLVEMAWQAGGRLQPGAMLPVLVVGLKYHNLGSERWFDSLTEHGDVGELGTAPGKAWQMRLDELQHTADRLSKGVGLKVLGNSGAEDPNFRHTDWEFFNRQADLQNSR